MEEWFGGNTMIRNLLYLLTIGWLFFILPCTAADESAAVATFDEALTAYNDSRYDDAYRGFVDITEDFVSPGVFVNAGNAAYRAGRDGEAALWYRRALVLDSNHGEAAQNLRFLKRRLGFLRFDIGALGEFTAFFRPPVWRLICACACGAAAICLVSLVMLSPHQRWRGRLYWGLAVGVVLGSISAIGLWVLGDQRQLLAHYIVTSADSSALTAPNDTAGAVVLLPPGSEIAYIERRGLWIYAELPGESRGWVRASQVAQLWPYSIRFEQ